MHFGGKNITVSEAYQKVHNVGVSYPLMIEPIFEAGPQEEAQIEGKISGVPAWDGTGMQKRIQARDRALGALGTEGVAEDFAGDKVARE